MLIYEVPEVAKICPIVIVSGGVFQNAEMGRWEICFRLAVNPQTTLSWPPSPTPSNSSDKNQLEQTKTFVRLLIKVKQCSTMNAPWSILPPANLIPRRSSIFSCSDYRLLNQHEVIWPVWISDRGNKMKLVLLLPSLSDNWLREAKRGELTYAPNSIRGSPKHFFSGTN